MKHKLYIAGIIGFVSALLLFVAFRLLTFKDPRIHFHANFALYVDDVKDEFKDPTFFEEVAICDADAKNNPRSRVHMHSEKPGEVHVHDKAATWGALFANLNYGLTSTSLKTDKGTYMDGKDGKKLSYYLNGKETGSIANVTIDSEDVLLINYGKEDSTTIKSRYDMVPKTAAALNKAKDPSACSGSAEFSALQKLKDILGIRRVE